MLSLKPGVSISRIQPQMVLGLISINSIFEVHGCDLVLTSVCDGRHKIDSRHYSGNAVDLRIWSIGGSDVEHLVSSIRRALGADFDVVLEVDHIHVEYDPKHQLQPSL